jgi:hypothetical protein
MLCGVEDRWQEMVAAHEPVARIFEKVEIEAMTVPEMEKFFEQAFGSAQIKVNEDAMVVMARYSAGFPKIMHLVGDAAYWRDKDGTIDLDDAYSAVLAAADDVGKKYVDQQVYSALRSEDYRSILTKIGKMGSGEMSFSKDRVVELLTASEKAKFDNFLQKMKKLKVLRSGEVRGEYVFNNRMVRLYIWLESSKGG